MVIKVKTLAEARNKILELEKQVEQLDDDLVEAEKENRTMAAVVNLMNKIGSYDELLEEVKKLSRRAHDLQEYNNEQVEARRKLADNLKHYKTLNEMIEKTLLREYVKLERKYNKLKGISEDDDL